MDDATAWERGDILETADGEQFMFGHYEHTGFWVHRLTKAGKMDNGSLGRWLSREGVRPAAFDPAKRGGWPARTAKPRRARPAAKKKPPRPHRWTGAGHLCGDCGAIKDTGEDPECPGSGETGYDLWLYHDGAGWWLADRGLADVAAAAARLQRRVGVGNVAAGAVLPAGEHLDLFTARRGVPK